MLIFNYLIIKIFLTGYVNIDRQRGFNLNDAETVLRDLAKFHGVPLALKLKNPDIFEKNVKVFCHDYHPFEPMVPLMNPVSTNVLKQDPECAQLLPKIALWGTKHFTPPREPFASISHGDMWLGNTMQLYKDGKIIKNKFIDFQFLQYRSIAADVLFFIWSSVQDEVISEHFDRLLKYYHFHLLQTLKDCNCSIDAFGYNQFLEEVKTEVDYEIGHALQFVVFVIHTKAPAEKPLTTESFAKAVTQRAKERAWFIVKECHKQGWL